ncbi:MAG: CBS domain-containing protein [Bacteroidetes bacterium]|nr:CBS domain-containing protein [Bacteroidota bacterium]
MKTVSDIISGRELYYVPLGITVIEAVKYMASKNVGAVVIVDNETNRNLRGIFSERDLLKRVVQEGLDPNTTKIEEVMTKNVAVGNANESYDVCLDSMKKIKSRHLPIVDGQRLIGMVSMRDLMEVKIQDGGEEIQMMNAYIHDIPKSSL